MKFSQTQATFIFLVSACIFIQGGFAIKCWDCRSNADPKCGDPFDNSTIAITDCAYASIRELDNLPGVRPTMCRKVIVKENGHEVTYRGCEWRHSVSGTAGECHPDALKAFSNGKVKFCQTCNDRDGCNGADSIATSGLWKAIIPLCVAIIARY